MQALTNVASTYKKQGSYDTNESKFAINSDDSSESNQTNTSQDDYREVKVDVHFGNLGCDSYMHEIHRLAYIKAQSNIISENNLNMLQVASYYEINL